MALFHVQFHSDALGQAMSLDVILPQKVYTQIGMASSEGQHCKVLYLLHGMSDDQTIWQRRTSIERYVADKNMAVVMPAAHLSWYTDMAFGGRYAEYIFREVPAYCQATFRQISDKREDNFIAGLSMGGYGALKGALTYPNQFCACAGLSGAYDVEKRFAKDPSSRYWTSIFGSPDAIAGSENDVYHLIEEVGKQDLKPAVYMWCGTDDSLYPETVRAHKLLEENHFQISYSETPGDHSWFYWDREILHAIQFFEKIQKQ